MIRLINGLICLASAAWMFRTFEKVQDQENNQNLQKFMWTYFTVLVLVGVHHVMITIFPIHDDLLSEMVHDGFITIVDVTQALGGVIFSQYLSSRNRQLTNPV